MKSNRVLVTGVGGGVGQSILKALQQTSYVSIASDCDALAAGLFAAEKSYLIPCANSPSFLGRITEICAAEEISLIFCGIEPELPIFAQHAAELRAHNITSVVSRPEVVELADDKLATAKFLLEHGFASPLTCALADYSPRDIPLPIVLKPRKGGARSQGVYVVRTERELEYRRQTVALENYIVQELLPGDEFTCGTLTFDRKCYGVITMRRVLRDGDTYKAFVVDEPAIRKCVSAIAELLDPFGPCNFQLRMKNGEPCIFEINARCSGTTACRAAAGFNEPLMCADFLLHGKVPEFVIRPLTLLRYWNEVVVENSQVASLRQTGLLAGTDKTL